eukprot:687297-Alexandrium_andersonii.AAC.2
MLEMPTMLTPGPKVLRLPNVPKAPEKFGGQGGCCCCCHGDGTRPSGTTQRSADLQPMSC